MPSALIATAVHTVPDVSVGHALLQMVLALAVIVVCIYGLSKVLARLRGGATRPGRHKPAGGLVVLSRQSLGKDLSIATVKWNDREVLVGISGSTITFLNDARADETAPQSEPVPEELPQRPRPATFSPALLAAAAARRGGEPTLAGTAGERRPSLLDALRDATLRR